MTVASGPAPTMRRSWPMPTSRSPDWFPSSYPGRPIVYVPAASTTVSGPGVPATQPKTGAARRAAFSASRRVHWLSAVIPSAVVVTTMSAPAAGTATSARAARARADVEVTPTGRPYADLDGRRHSPQGSGVTPG